MRKLYYCFALIAFTSCGSTLGYVGNSYTPTSKVDVYVDETSIKRKFDIVGKGYISSMVRINPEKVQSSAVHKAKQKGADAILIKDYITPGTSIHTSYRTDSVNKGTVSVGNTTVGRDASTEFYVLFLKYTE